MHAQMKSRHFPELRKTKPGDLWLLGDHLLLCGDATLQEHLQRLTEDEQIDCLITDPPYGVSYHSRGKKREQWGLIENDNLDAASLESLLRTVFQMSPASAARGRQPTSAMASALPEYE